MLRFLKLTLVIDIVGVIGVILATIGFYYTNLTSSETAQLFANLGIELIGSWISVRIIEYVIRKREDYKNARTQILRNLRYFLNYTRRLREGATNLDTETLMSELKYTRHVFESRKKHLDEGEIAKCLSAYNMIEDLISKIIISIEKTEDFRRRTNNLNQTINSISYRRIPSGDKGYMLDYDLKVLLEEGNRIVYSRDHDNIMLYSYQTTLIGNWDFLSENNYSQDVKRFIDTCKLAAAAKEDIYNNWMHFEFCIRNIEDDIREETPEL